MAKQWFNHDPVANLIIIDRSIYVMNRNVNRQQTKFDVLVIMNECMPVTNISYKLRQIFLQTGMLYWVGEGRF